MVDPDWNATFENNFVILNFTKNIAFIEGTGYKGEIKKGIFSALNFILPVYKNTLPMHCSANFVDNGETAIFFGLSWTGKTTLSTDPKRKLIGNEEHGGTARILFLILKVDAMRRWLIWVEKTSQKYSMRLKKVLS